MPTTYAHYKFGKDVTNALPRPLQTAIQNNREMFEIGLHGPDILFYYDILAENPIGELGVHLHQQNADRFFQRAARIILQSENPAAARAYIYGFICHYILDSECHKYIEKMSHVSGLSHHEIEMEFDRYLLTEGHINPLTFVGAKNIQATRENARLIAPFFDDLSEAQVLKSLQHMKRCHKWMQVPTAKRRQLLTTAMKVMRCYDSKSGMIMSEEANPRCQEYCLLLKKLFAGAVPLAVGMIVKYQKVLFQDAPLPERFEQRFDAGENWRDLPL
jgi:hypothetical protein